jgi:SAM-dependent methyltransferase/ribosomal protein S27AE
VSTSNPLNSRAERIAALGFSYAEQDKESVDGCNLCGGDDWVIVAHRDRYGFPARAQACGRCGLTVLAPRMTPRAYGNFYERVYRPLVSAYHSRVIDARSVQAEQRAYAVEMGDFIAPFLAGRPAPSFLDVGGSTGVIAADFAQRFGTRATIIDPAPDEIAEAQALGIETVTALVEEWEPQGRRFDVVGMFQTIDHLLDVRATLAKLRELIASDGLLVVDIVDFRAAYLRAWSVEDAVKIDHPYYLTEPTMEAYLKQAGFQIRRRSYASEHKLVVYACTPTDPDATSLPDPAGVERFFRELRYVQSAPPPGAR